MQSEPVSKPPPVMEREPTPEAPEPTPEPIAPPPAPEPVKLPSLSIDFDTGSGVQTLEIKEQPLGMIFKNAKPLSVASVELGGAADKAGIKPDWIFKRVAGEPVNEYADLLSRLRAGVEPLAKAAPDPAGSCVVVFVTENAGYTKKVCFTRRPIGLSYDKKLPLVVKKLEAGGHAAQLGVQIGWTFNSINGKPLKALTQQEQFDLLASATSTLP